MHVGFVKTSFSLVVLWLLCSCTKENRLAVSPLQSESPRRNAIQGASVACPPKDKDSVSVREFGAKGDNATDDSASIQAAIRCAAGGTVYFPPGNYLIQSSIAIDGATGARLRGQGQGTSVVNNQSGAPAFLVEFPSNPNPAGVLGRCVFERLQINSTPQQSGTIGIQTTTSCRTELKEMMVARQRRGVDVMAPASYTSDPVGELVVTASDIRYHEEEGIRVTGMERAGAFRTAIRGSYLISNGNAIVVEGSLEMRNTEVAFNRGVGISLFPNSRAPGTAVVEQSHFDTNGGSHFLVLEPANVRNVDLYFHNGLNGIRTRAAIRVGSGSTTVQGVALEGLNAHVAESLGDPVTIVQVEPGAYGTLVRDIVLAPASQPAVELEDRGQLTSIRRRNAIGPYAKRVMEFGNVQGEYRPCAKYVIHVVTARSAQLTILPPSPNEAPDLQGEGEGPLPNGTVVELVVRNGTNGVDGSPVLVGSNGDVAVQLSGMRGEQTVIPRGYVKTTTLTRISALGWVQTRKWSSPL